MDICGGQRPPLEDVIQTAKQIRDGFFGFVAHVGKAEGLAFNLPVAGIGYLNNLSNSLCVPVHSQITLSPRRSPTARYCSLIRTDQRFS